jgi:choline transport protein
MNYTCLCLGAFLIIETIWWFVARKEFTERILKAKEENHVAEVVEPTK